MGLMFWWLALAGAVAMAVWFYIARRRAKKPRSATGKPLAHSHRLTRLPRYQQVLRQTYILTIAALSLGGVALVCALVLLGRPSAVTVESPEAHNRDIVLCLDLSGSMSIVDARIAQTFSELVTQFKGERIGMTVFDNSAVTVFPLTSDYSYISHVLQEVKKSLDGQQSEVEMYSGIGQREGSSLIGDGLASCIARFDQTNVKRSRSIIFATDNEVAGKQIVTMPQAAALATARQIRIYGLNPSDYSTGANDPYASDEVKEFRRLVLQSGGDYYRLEDVSVVDSVVRKIEEQEATLFRGTPQLVVNDAPVVPMVVLFVATVGMMVLNWRLKR